MFPYLLCLTQPAPPQGDSSGTERECILRHPNHTPSICTGASDPALGQGSICGVAVDLHTAQRNPAQVCAGANSHSCHHCHRWWVEGGVRARPMPSPRGWHGTCQRHRLGVSSRWIYTCQPPKPALLCPGLLPPSFRRPPKAPWAQRVQTGAESPPPPGPSAQLGAWHKADVGE